MYRINEKCRCSMTRQYLARFCSSGRARLVVVAHISSLVQYIREAKQGALAAAAAAAESTYI